MKAILPILATTDADMAGAVLFYLFALMAGGSAIGVVISRNIVRTAVFLLFTLTGVAGLYFLLNAEFLAAVQLVVYAGGTLILIVFGVMLTSKSPFSRFEPKLVEVIVALSIAVILLTALIMAIHRTPFPQSADVATDGYPMAQLGQALLGDYLVPFELASVLLLVVMIGAAYLAKGRRREEGTPAQSQSRLSSQARQWS
ncbi:MAG TPA: NADH-quinone oxidoreductase subunit J [Tepidisphaeraceae bacterium]|nr:NADH-quinone oxidoreductase subunit J [Tepidisphaeraceae bacterium]